MSEDTKLTMFTTVIRDNFREASLNILRKLELVAEGCASDDAHNPRLISYYFRRHQMEAVYQGSGDAWISFYRDNSKYLPTVAARLDQMDQAFVEDLMTSWLSKAVGF